MWILVCQVVSFCGIPLGQCRVRSVTLALRGGSSTPLGSHTDAVHWVPGIQIGGNQHKWSRGVIMLSPYVLIGTYVLLSVDFINHCLRHKKSKTNSLRDCNANSF